MTDHGAEKAFSVWRQSETLREMRHLEANPKAAYVQRPGLTDNVSLYVFSAGFSSRDAEVSSLRSDVERLRKAIKEYKAEMENPVPDVSMRRALREKLFKAVLEDANE